MSFSFLSTVKKKKWWVVAGSMGLILLVMASTAAAKQLAPWPTKKIVINIPSFTLSLMEGDKIIKKYPVAVGKPSAPTPVGEFKIINKVVNPTWYPPDGGRPVLPGPTNPLGRRWMGFLPNGYGIHGNNNQNSIGQAVSLGCVRMHNSDIEELFEWVPVGVDLKITYETVDVEGDPTTGQTYLVLYPDVYHRGVPTVTAVHNKLQALGLSDYVTKERIAAALNCGISAPTYICLGMKVRINGKEAVVDTEIVNGETLVAVRPIAEALGMSVSWDPDRQAVIAGSTVLSVHVKTGQSFVHLSDLETKLGIKSYWCETEQLLELFTWRIKVGQVELTQGAWSDKKEVWLPVGAIAHAIGLPVEQIPEQALVIDNQKRQWSGKVQGNNIFVSAQMLTEMLPVKVIMLSDQQLIDIMYLPEGMVEEQSEIPINDPL